MKSITITGEIESISRPPEEVPLSPSNDSSGTIWKKFREGDKITITGKNMQITHNYTGETNED